jgi:hypothetical protein
VKQVTYSAQIRDPDSVLFDTEIRRTFCERPAASSTAAPAPDSAQVSSRKVRFPAVERQFITFTVTVPPAGVLGLDFVGAAAAGADSEFCARAGAATTPNSAAATVTSR